MRSSTEIHQKPKHQSSTRVHPLSGHSAHHCAAEGGCPSPTAPRQPEQQPSSRQMNRATSRVSSKRTKRIGNSVTPTMSTLNHSYRSIWWLVSNGLGTELSVGVQLAYWSEDGSGAGEDGRAEQTIGWPIPGGTIGAASSCSDRLSGLMVSNASSWSGVAVSSLLSIEPRRG